LIPLRRAKPRKYCNLQIKLNIFKKSDKNEAQKKHQKKYQKQLQKRALDPSKWSSRRGKTLGFEKYIFLQKKRKPKNVSFLCGSLLAPDPVFYKEF
jgi:hypothetical protein